MTVPITTTAIVPTDRELSLTVYEDLTGDGSATNQVTYSVAHGTETRRFDALQGGADARYAILQEHDTGAYGPRTAPRLLAVTIEAVDAAPTPISTAGLHTSAGTVRIPLYSPADVTGALRMQLGSETGHARSVAASASPLRVRTSSGTVGIEIEGVSATESESDSDTDHAGGSA